jgi:hypothetical protein
MRAELDAIMAGFGLLPDPAGQGQKGFSGGSWNNPVITGGSVNNTPIGATAANTGKFTTLGATGLATLAGGGSLTGTFTALAAAILAGFAISGGTVDAAPIGATTPAAGTFSQLTVNGSATFNGPIVTAGGFASSTGSLELGSTSVSQMSYVDFHSSGAGSDYDTRIASTGGSATAGQGTLTYTALAHAFNTRPTFAGAVPWDSVNLPAPMNAAGATMTGNLVMSAAGTYSAPITFKAGTYAPFVRSNATSQQLEFVNSANTAVNMSLSDGGNLTVRGGATFGTRPTFAGLTPWDTGNFNPANYVPLSGATMSGTLNSVAGGDSNGYQSTIGQGFIKLNQYSYGAYIDFAQARSQDYVWRIHYDPSSAYFQFIQNGGGYVQMASVNGGSADIWCSGYGWIWQNGLAGKVPIRRSNGISYGYVLSDTDNTIVQNWGGQYINLYVDSQFQGGLLTTNNYGNVAAPVGVVQSSGVGSYVYSKYYNANAHGPGISYGTNVTIPGQPGTWQSRNMSVGIDEQLYIRIA